ncbi:DUF7710 domain-containing protein [Micromonospora sp. H33]|uniref:DUF7710 domain-containing protein n=1 Tax=Micromonospora sp. H33 TaxID=3452215 RepID=UPI003F8B21E3
MQTPASPDPRGAATSTVWVFHGSNARFASGVFQSQTDGLAWAAQHRLSGILSEYPVGVGCYDQAVAAGRFRPSKPHHGTPDHVAAFSPSLSHLHLTDGVPD